MHSVVLFRVNEHAYTFVVLHLLVALLKIQLTGEEIVI